ncbi:MAG: NAD(P)-dependent oxidoreductase [Chloroflexota bacterium]|nr:NAD(P)-dependent oxidoreductase [Chloroflexota bacterium]
MSKPVLITGGAGSVGRQLAGMLLEDGRSVRIFDLPFMDFSGLEGEEGVEVVKGDITDAAAVSSAVAGVAGVLHLAAILPPNSEKDRDFTFRVNVDGTRNIVEGMKAGSPEASLVFTSSISTYGDTSGEEPPVTIEHQQGAIDVYADSKIAGEEIVISSGVNYVILRIASIAVPAFLEPPEPWPFTSEQRVEMVHRDDVADALRNAVDSGEAVGKVFNIAGGSSWRLTGKDYVEDFFNVMGAPVDMAVYREDPGWNDWYDTEESQRILRYQNRSYDDYCGQMKAIVEEMMAG